MNWDYKNYNYCLRCHLKYTKDVMFCKECNWRTRKLSHHKTGQKEYIRY